MSNTMYGYDRYKISTPVEVRRGSTVILRRQCQVIDYETYRESPLDISGATAIRWDLVQDLKSASTYVLMKYLSGGIALINGGTTGIYEVTLNASDLRGQTPGTYKACLAVTLPSGLYKFRPYHFVLLAAPPSGE